jgi:hypothetical protein
MNKHETLQRVADLRQEDAIELIHQSILNIW